jgi:formylglycine-generating enzyme required for sulfatase activity
MKKGKIYNHRDYEKFFDKDSPLNCKDNSPEKNSVNNIVKAFDIAVQTREFETKLYWTRSNYFWVFVSAIAVAWHHTKDNSLFINFSVMLLGFIVSFVWFCASKGNKYWQNNWEANIYYLSRILKVPVFELLLDPACDNLCKLNSKYRYSVSKLNQFVSLAVTVSWMLLIYYTVCKNFIDKIDITWAINFINSVNFINITRIEDSIFLKYFVCLLVPTAIMSLIVIIIHRFAASADLESKNPPMRANPRIRPVLPAYPMRRVSGGTVKKGMAWTPTCNLPLSVDAFEIGGIEITYELWCGVREWAVSKECEEYVFANPGCEGSHGTEGAAPTAGKKMHPVTNVSWLDCVVWCNAYSEATGRTPVYYEDASYTVVLRTSETGRSSTCNAKAACIKADADGFRLPTEAEWEYAARGGVPSTAAPWTYTYAGTDGTTPGPLEDYAWYKGNSASTTHSVAEKKFNSLCLYDMSGNVWEWCWNKYSSGSADRVVRGGSWNDNAAGCTVVARGRSNRHSRVGFRVVCPAEMQNCCRDAKNYSVAE